MMSALHDRHRWVVDFSRANGRYAGSASIDPDWEPARQFLRFEGVRRHPIAEAPVLGFQVEPGWHVGEGRPRVGKVKVSARTLEGGFSADLDLEYFRAAAVEKSSELVKRGQLEVGETFHFNVNAYAIDGNQTDMPSRQGGLEIEVEEEEVTLAVGEAPIAAFRKRCICSRGGGRAGAGGKDSETDGDELPIFVEPAIIEEAGERAGRAGDVETGGVLVGHVLRDPATREIFADVAALIPAVHAEASSTHLTFTPDTWAAVEAARRLRGRDECVLGWLHTHPDWCRNCPEDRAARCPLNKDFFSRDDVNMHRTCFPGAHQMALLLSDHGGTTTTSCYGWRRGVIAGRGFHLLSAVADVGGGATANVGEQAKR